MAQQPLVGQGLLTITIILRHTTISRTLLDEWSARRWDLYLTTHNTYKRNTLRPAGFEPTIPASERPQTYVVYRAATGTGARCLEGSWTVEKCGTYMRCEVVVVFVNCVVIRLSDGHRRWRECSDSIFRVDYDDGGIVATRLYGVRTHKTTVRTWYFSYNEWETVLIN
jgi:hypothetical protein